MKGANVIGWKVAWLSHQQGWSQNDLIIHLLSKIDARENRQLETLRSALNSKQIVFLAQVFRRKAPALVPTSHTTFDFVCLARLTTDK
jgi:hypothetical protein